VSKPTDSDDTDVLGASRDQRRIPQQSNLTAQLTWFRHRTA
jgi:hypothetical protein